MAGLVVTDASVRLGGTDIISKADLRLEPGQFTAIIGPNGAGKSTLLKVAAGQLKANRGQVMLAGRPIASYPVAQAARHRAVMPQDSSVAFPFTVRDVVAMGRTAWRSAGAPTEDYVAQALELTDMTCLADRDITTLSGGERQRAALARVIAQILPITPERILLLDEPTSAMDIAHAEASLRLLRELRAHGCAIGVVLHDIDAAACYADDIVLMSRGRVVTRGPAAHVCTSERLTHVYGTPIDVFRHGEQCRIAPRRRLGDY